MYCEKCGANNSETAVYCRKCGVRLAAEPEEETRIVGKTANDKAPSDIAAPVRRAESDGSQEEMIFSIGPTLKFVKAGYVAAAIGALLFAGITSSLLSKYITVWDAVFLGLLLFLIPAYFHVRQKLVRYTLTDSKLEIDTGLIAKNTRNVPIRRIQDVTVSSSPWQRLFGFGDVTLDNASEDGGKTVLKNIDTPKHYADELLEQMRRIEK